VFYILFIWCISNHASHPEKNVLSLISLQTHKTLVNLKENKNLNIFLMKPVRFLSIHWK